MFWTIKVVIGDGERGLVYRNRRFQQILLPGVHRLSPFGGRPHVDIHTASKGAAYTGSDQDSLIEAPARSACCCATAASMKCCRRAAAVCTGAVRSIPRCR